MTVVAIVTVAAMIVMTHPAAMIASLIPVIITTIMAMAAMAGPRVGRRGEAGCGGDRGRDDERCEAQTHDDNPFGCPRRPSSGPGR